jgi:hypothetical protein
MFPETGPCPRCGRAARFVVVHFDSRLIRVDCSGEGGRFEVPKCRIDDARFDGTETNFDTLSNSAKRPIIPI